MKKYAKISILVLATFLLSSNIFAMEEKKEPKQPTQTQMSKNNTKRQRRKRNQQIINTINEEPVNSIKEESCYKEYREKQNLSSINLTDFVKEKMKKKNVFTKSAKIDSDLTKDREVIKFENILQEYKNGFLKILIDRVLNDRNLDENEIKNKIIEILDKIRKVYLEILNNKKYSEKFFKERYIGYFNEYIKKTHEKTAENLTNIISKDIDISSMLEKEAYYVYPKESYNKYKMSEPIFDETNKSELNKNFFEVISDNRNNNYIKNMIVELAYTLQETSKNNNTSNLEQKMEFEKKKIMEIADYFKEVDFSLIEYLNENKKEEIEKVDKDILNNTKKLRYNTLYSRFKLATKLFNYVENNYNDIIKKYPAEIKTSENNEKIKSDLNNKITKENKDSQQDNIKFLNRISHGKLKSLNKIMEKLAKLNSKLTSIIDSSNNNVNEENKDSQQENVSSINQTISNVNKDMENLQKDFKILNNILNNNDDILKEYYEILNKIDLDLEKLISLKNRINEENKDNQQKIINLINQTIPTVNKNLEHLKKVFKKLIEDNANLIENNVESTNNKTV